MNPTPNDPETPTSTSPALPLSSSLLTNRLTGAEVLHFREAEHFFQAAGVHYAAFKSEKYIALHKVCTDAYQALHKVRSWEKDGEGNLLREVLAVWLGRLEREREKARV
jgi:hypothetical protein